MLVLTRRQNERIVLPELGIAIEVVRIKGNAVQIGIDAPPSVRVMRQELLTADAGQPKPTAIRDRRPTLTHAH